MASSPNVKTLAEAEVHGQTTFAAKLKEMAAAKELKLLKDPDETAKKKEAMQKEQSGEIIDKFSHSEMRRKGPRVVEKAMINLKFKAGCGHWLTPDSSHFTQRLLLARDFTYSQQWGFFRLSRPSPEHLSHDCIPPSPASGHSGNFRCSQARPFTLSCRSGHLVDSWICRL